MALRNDDPDYQEALAAHLRGDRTASVQRLQRFVLRHPHEWEAALELKAEMASLGCYAEADPAFRKARQFFPNAIWATHLASLYAFPQGELPDLILRARAMTEAQPEDADLHRLLANMLRQARDYAGAAQAYARDPDPEAVRLAREMQSYQMLQRRLSCPPTGGPTPIIAVINLDRNTERLSLLKREFCRCQMPLLRIPGVEGSRIPAVAIRRLGGTPSMRGTLGCFLSHIAAWEAISAQGIPHCLVVEDDVIPLLDLPADWRFLNLPNNFDICFVNDRLAPSSRSDGFSHVTLSEAMLAFPTWRNAPGADGYLLSALGARKLLAWVYRDGFAGDVDWRLLAYSLTALDCAALPTGSEAYCTLTGIAANISSSERLIAMVAAPALIRTVPINSDREDENRAEIGFRRW